MAKLTGLASPAKPELIDTDSLVDILLNMLFGLSITRVKTKCGSFIEFHLKLEFLCSLATHLGNVS